MLYLKFYARAIVFDANFIKFTVENAMSLRLHCEAVLFSFIYE